MKSSAVKPTHITKSNVFDDLGFSPSQALELKIKSDLWLALREEIERHRYTQRDLCRILDEYQPEVSNLLNGRISKMSIEKLLRYAGRLSMKATLKITAGRMSEKKSPRRSAA
jgi:predicted XRE-type DNA-binding protein